MARIGAAILKHTHTRRGGVWAMDRESIATNDLRRRLNGRPKTICTREIDGCRYRYLRTEFMKNHYLFLLNAEECKYLGLGAHRLAEMGIEKKCEYEYFAMMHPIIIKMNRKTREEQKKKWAENSIQKRACIMPKYLSRLLFGIHTGNGQSRHDDDGRPCESSYAHRPRNRRDLQTKRSSKFVSPLLSLLPSSLLLPYFLPPPLLLF